MFTMLKIFGWGFALVGGFIIAGTVGSSDLYVEQVKAHGVDAVGPGLPFWREVLAIAIGAIGLVGGLVLLESIKRFEEGGRLRSLPLPPARRR